MLRGPGASQGRWCPTISPPPPLPNPGVDSETHKEASTHTEPGRRKPGGHTFLFLNVSRGSGQSPEKVEFGRWEGHECYAKAPRPPRPNQQEMTSPFPTSEDALKECLHLLLNTQRGGFPPSSPRGNRPPPPSARKRREGVAPPRVLWAPSPRLPLPLKATRRKDGRRGWLWAATIGMVGAAARRSPRSGPRTEPPTGASFPPHSPRARRTMAPVGPRRSASARRPGLQLPGIPAVRPT